MDEYSDYNDNDVYDFTPEELQAARGRAEMRKERAALAAKEKEREDEENTNE